MVAASLFGSIEPILAGQILPVSQHSKRSVRILNPIGERTHTNRRSARRYVEAGRADWRGNHAIEFKAESRSHLAAAAAAIAPAPAARPHSPNVSIRQREIGRYRNDVLGLPNFVGFIGDKATHGRRKAA